MIEGFLLNFILIFNKKDIILEFPPLVSVLRNFSLPILLFYGFTI